MAARFWVGGTGTWNSSDTTHWSATSGGSAGASAPTAADDVTFDASSGTGTVTTNATAAANSITYNSSTLTSLTLGAALNISASTTGSVTLTSGLLNLNGNTLTVKTFSSNNANTRSIQFSLGAGKIVCNGSGTVWDTATATGLSIVGSPAISISNSGATATTVTAHTTGGTASNALDFSFTTGTYALTLTTGSVLASLDFTGFTGTWAPGTSTYTLYGSATLVSGMAFTTGTGTWTFAHTSGNAIITAGGKTLPNITQTGAGGTVRFPAGTTTLATTATYTLTAGTLDIGTNTATLSTGLFSSSNTNARSIIFGTGNITTTGSGTAWNTNTETNLSYTGTPTVNISNNSATATTISVNQAIGARSNAFNFNITVGTYALTVSSGSTFLSLNFTGFTGTWAPGTATYTFYGSVTLVSGMTFTTGSGTWTFANTLGTSVLTAGGKTFPNITQNNVGGTVQLASNVSCLIYTLTAGTLDLNNVALSVSGGFSSTNTNVRSILFGTTGSISLIDGAASNAWNTTNATNFSYTGTSNVRIGNGSLNSIVAHTTGGTASNALNFTVIGGSTITITTASVLNSLVFSGYPGTFSPASYTLYGNLTLIAGMSYTTGSGTYTFAATSGTQTITSAGKTLYSISVGTTGTTTSTATVSLADALTAAGNLTFYSGTFSTNNNTVTLTNTSGTSTTSISGTGTCTINFGSSTINCANNWDFTAATTLTLNVGTSTLNMNYNAPSNGTNFLGGSYTYYDVNITTPANGTQNIGAGSTFRNLTFVASTYYTGGAKSQSLIQGNLTVTGTLATSGTAFARRVGLFGDSTTLGTGSATITAAAISLSYVNFQKITAAGASGTWSGTGFNDCGQNSNITFPTKTVYWNQAAGGNFGDAAWALTSGGAVSSANIPYVQDTVIIDNAGLTTGNTITMENGTLTTTWGWAGYNLGYWPNITSTRTNGWVFTSANSSINYVNGKTINFAGATSVNFSNNIRFNLSSSISSSAALSLGTAGIVIGGDSFTTAATLTLNSNITLTTVNAFTTFTSGTLNLNNFTLSTGTFTSSNTNTRTVQFGTGAITVRSTGTAFNTTTATGLTYTGTPTVNMSNATAIAATITAHTTGGTESNAFSFNVNAGSYALTLTTGSVVKGLDFTGFTGTWAPGTATTTLYGSLTLVSGMTFTTGTGLWTWGNTSGTASITSAGKTLYSITQNGAGGTVSLADTLTLGATSTYTLTAGTFDTNGQSASIGLFSSNNSNTRAVTFTSNTLTLTGTGTVWDTGTITGMTLTQGTGTISISGATATFAGGGDTYYNVAFTNTTAGNVSTITGTNTFNNLTVTAAAAGSAATILTFGANQTISGTLSASGSSTLARATMNSSVAGTQRTITATTVSLVGINFQDINAQGSIPWTGTSLVNLGNNSNITFASKTVYWSLLAGGNWSSTAWALTSGGTPSSSYTPIPGDIAIIDDTGLTAGNTITLDATYLGTFSNLMPTINCTRTNAWTHASGSTTPIFAGANITLTSATTMTGTGAWQTEGTGTLTIGCTFVPPLTIGDGTTATTTTLGSNLTASSNCTLTNGTLSLGTYTLSVNTFTSNNSNTRTIAFGTGNITTTGSGTAWTTATATNLTYTGTPTVNISNNSATATTVTAGTTGGASTNAFDFNFTTGTYTLTLTSASQVRGLNFTGFTGTWAPASNTTTFYGDLTLVSGMTFTTGGGVWTWANTSGVGTITAAGKNLDPITQNGAGGTVRFAANTTILGTYTLTAGTLDVGTNTVTLNTQAFSSSNSNVRSIIFGTGNITISGTGAPVFTTATATNLTYTGTPTVNISYSGATALTVTAGTTGGAETNAFDFNFTTGTYALTLTTASQVRGLNFTGFTGTWSPGTATTTFYGDLTLVSGMTFTTGSGLWTWANTSGTAVITSAGKTLFSITQSGVGGTVRLAAGTTTLSTTATYAFQNGTLDLGTNTATLSTGLFTSNNPNTRSIIFGTGNITVTGNAGTVVSMATMTGFSYTGTPNINSNYAGATGTRTFSLGSTAGATESNAVNLNITAGTDTIALTNADVFRNLNWSGYTGTWTLSTSNYTMYGDLTWGSGMTLTISGAGTFTFAGTSGTSTITCNGKSMGNVTINGVGKTVALGDTFSTNTTNGTLTLTNGTFNANNQNLSVVAFSSSNSNTRTITMGSGTWTLTGTGTIWDITTATNLTVNPNTSTILLSNTTTTARAFNGGGKTYNNLTIGGATGISTLTFTGANTFNTLASTKTVAHTIVFPNVTTTVSDWTITGTAGNVVTLQRTGASGTWAIAKSGGGVISTVDYLSISNSTATPSSTWYAGANSTDGGGNTGWIFGIYPGPAVSNYFLLF